MTPTRQLPPANAPAAGAISPARRETRLPEWLRRPLGGGPGFARTAGAVEGGRLHTICEEARCPNRGECWSAGTATFLIMGDRCTRNCGFCSVLGGRPDAPPDPTEPDRLASAVARMGLRHVVVTSVNRDDLADGGAGHFAACVRALRATLPDLRIELLTPDFRRRQELAVETLLPLAPLIWGHNVETVPRLYTTVRPGSRYGDTLDLLRRAAAAPGIIAKSSMMLGLGERTDEVIAVIDDLAAAGVRRLTLGQYLQPTGTQLEVIDYVHPDRFAELGAEARRRGIPWVIAAPFARSSYHAELEVAL